MPARREQILDAAATVIAVRGYERATIRQIASAAGVSDGTIYNHFADKAALLDGLVERLVALESRPVELGRAPSDLRAVLRAFARQRLAVLTADVELVRATWPELLVDPARRTSYFEAVLRPTLAAGEAFLATRVERGELRCDDPGLAARLVTGSLLGLALLRLLGDEGPGAHAAVLPDAIADLLFEALGGTPDASSSPSDRDPGEAR